MPSLSQMKRRIFLFALTSTPALAADASDVVAELYHDQLAALGRWHDLAGVGQAWRPDAVPPDWRPFSSGRWRYTFEAGWYWQGTLPFSAVAEHRGRWRFIQKTWWWLPGVRFEPAPVAWGRPGRDWVAWSPLPGGGAAPNGWSELPLRELVDPNAAIASLATDASIERTAPPEPGEVAAASGRPIEPIPLGDLVSADDLTAWFNTGNRGVSGIAQPALQRPAAAAVPRPSGPTSPDDGWSAFERQHRNDLRENQRLLERDRRRDRDLVR